MDFGKFPSHHDQQAIIDTQLISAAKASDVEQVKFCLAAGASEKTLNIALEESVKSGHEDSIEIICLLTKNGASLPNRAINDFFAAIKEGNSDRVFSFTVAGIQHRYAVNDQGQTPLMVAAQHGHIDLIEKFVKEGAELNAVANNNKQYTAMDYAAIYATKTQDTTALEIFIDCDAIMNHELSIPSGDRYSRREIQVPLIIWASYHGLSHIVANLLEKDNFMIGVADSAQLKTPLMWAIIQGQAATATILIEHIKRIKEFLKEADTEENLINAIDSSNYTAMDYAAIRASKNQDTVLLEMLIASGAIMNHTLTIPRGDRYHRNIDVSLITWAAYHGLTHLVTILLAQDNSIIETVDPIQFKTPLMWALTRGETATAIKLLDLGANHDIRTDNGANLIQLAIQKKNATFVSYLLKHKEFGFIADHQLLEKAINSGCVDTAKAVLEVILAEEKVKEVKAEESICKTSSFLFQAASLGNADIVHLLLKQNFGIDQVNPDDHPTHSRKTALWAAVYFNKIEVLDVLLNEYAQKVILDNQKKDQSEKIEIHADFEKHLKDRAFLNILLNSDNFVRYRLLSSLPTKRVNQLGDTLAFESSVNTFKVEMHKVRTKMLAMLGVPDKKIEAPVVPVTEKSFWENMVSYFCSVIDMIKNAFGFTKPVMAETPILPEIQPELDYEHSILSMLPAELISMVIWREFPFWYQHRLDKDVNFVCQSIQSVITAKKMAAAEKKAHAEKIALKEASPQKPLEEVEPVLQHKPVPVVFSSLNGLDEIKENSNSEKNLEQNAENSEKEAKTKVLQPS